MWGGASDSAAAKQAEVFLLEKLIFWPEISALRVFLNFDNERMRPPKYQSAPPPPDGFHRALYKYFKY